MNYEFMSAKTLHDMKDLRNGLDEIISKLFPLDVGKARDSRTFLIQVNRWKGEWLAYSRSMNTSQFIVDLFCKIDDPIINIYDPNFDSRQTFEEAEEARLAAAAAGQTLSRNIRTLHSPTISSQQDREQANARVKQLLAAQWEEDQRRHDHLIFINRTSPTDDSAGKAKGLRSRGLELQPTDLCPVIDCDARKGGIPWKVSCHNWRNSADDGRNGIGISKGIFLSLCNPRLQRWMMRPTTSLLMVVEMVITMAMTMAMELATTMTEPGPMGMTMSFKCRVPFPAANPT